MSKEWQLSFLGCFQVVFDDVTDDFSFIVAESHGLVVGQATPHIPAHF
jgi:hypothetical protein